MNEETPDERAERLVRIGLQVAARLRDEDPRDVRRVVDALPVDEVRDLAVLLAAHVPVDQPRSRLLRWWYAPARGRELRPCGTPTAAKRHQARGEPVDEACREALRAYDRQRKRRERMGAGGEEVVPR